MVCSGWFYRLGRRPLNERSLADVTIIPVQPTRTDYTLRLLFYMFYERVTAEIDKDNKVLKVTSLSVRLYLSLLKPT